MRRLRTLLLLPLVALLAGCDAAILNPAGDIALQQRNLIIASTGLMLLIILPVMAFTLIFAWRYRATNTDAAYDPDWHHSTQLEVLIWTAPLLIIIALGALTWISTHVLDPYRKLDRLAAATAVPADAKPLRVDVVALDWKWLFLYPDQGIATVNELAAPVDVPIEFHITSASVMNSFFVPSLAGQIYAMAGMETKLHAVVNREGIFDGLSANYSGAGFSKMNFKFHAVSQGDFDAWVAKAKQSNQTLDRPAYVALEKPSEAVPVRYFSGVETGLFNAVLNMCAEPGKMCMSQMMHLDAMGGGGKESAGNLDRLRYDNRRIEKGDEPSGATFPASGRAPRSEGKTDGKTTGQGGQAMPGMDHDMPGMQHDTPAPDQINK